uniref:C-type lectin domain-containing protein n=1 Tax=Chrysemys picta bellii TaxID=8478 RepID=A0A8C3HGI7_CHRPI
MEHPLGTPKISACEWSYDQSTPAGIWPCLFLYFTSIYLEVGQRPSQNCQMAAVPQTSPKNPLLITVPFPRPEGSGCKLCPRHWVPHRDKCYWLSEENQYWNRGHDDCSQRRSHLLVIQDREELVKNNLTGNQNPVWIGLNITSPGRKWTWVDGSPLNQTLFTVSGPAEENSCAAVKKNQIKSEICNTHYKWICQKEAVRI